jgi:hypothetical protein
LESVLDFKFCYECFGSGGENGPVIFPAFKAYSKPSQHGAQKRNTAQTPHSTMFTRLATLRLSAPWRTILHDD